MRYNKIQRCEYVNGNNIGVSLFLQGCSIHCKGCFNPETWDFNEGREFTPRVKKYLFNLLNKEYITRFSVLGGEPLERCNWKELNNLIKQVKQCFPEIKIWLYTGHTNEYWNTTHKDRTLTSILKNIDVLVTGPYIQEQKDLTLPFRGSSNQEIIDVRRSWEEHKKITLYDV